MNVRATYQSVLKVFTISFLFLCFVLLPQAILARNSGSVESYENYSREELSQMLAPIALYPDSLLSQVLMASTYPIEVIEADRWIRNNPDLEGEFLDTELSTKDWSPSIKAICYFPSILNLMGNRINQTTALGSAFLSQEAQVMDIIQELRDTAYDHGTLASDTRQNVIVEDGNILIAPAESRVIYVPYYDPVYIYGGWMYADHPPHYWGPASISGGISYWPDFYFGLSFGTWSYFDWRHRYIHINAHKRPKYVSSNRWKVRHGRWHHAPRHRKSLSPHYRTLAKKHGKHTSRYRNFRRDTPVFSRYGDSNMKRHRDDREKISKAPQTRQRPRFQGQSRTKAKWDNPRRLRGNRNDQIPKRVDQKNKKYTRVERHQVHKNRGHVFSRARDNKKERKSFKHSRAGRHAFNHEPRKMSRFKRHFRDKHRN